MRLNVTADVFPPKFSILFFLIALIIMHGTRERAKHYLYGAKFEFVLCYAMVLGVRLGR